MPLSLAFIRNMRVPMPWSIRSRLAARNNMRKVTQLQLCCGNPGQPGC